MQAETFDDLLEWTRGLHIMIAERLEQALNVDTDQRRCWLMEYIAGHERHLAHTIERFRTQASQAERNTWLYEHLGEKLPPRARWELSFVGLTFDEISQQVFHLHNQLIALYRSVAGCAVIPQAVELMDNMLVLQEGATRLLAEQCGRLYDL